LDVDRFQACLEANTFTNAYVEDIRYAQSLGVTGTPTFLVNGELLSANELMPAVEALLTD
jgi:protein-disulfide isomerase